MSFFKDLIDKTKGQAVSMAARQFLNAYLEKYGTMVNFSVQPDTKTITAEILLKGEASPVKITLNNYAIGGAPGKPTLSVASATASREWLQVVLDEFLVGKPINLPPKAAPLLKLLL